MCSDPFALGGGMIIENGVGLRAEGLEFLLFALRPMLFAASGVNAPDRSHIL